MDRVAFVYYQDLFAGELRENDLGYHFNYDTLFLTIGTPLSYTLPLVSQSFYSKDLFPFFENLLSEGWMRGVQSTEQHIAKDDLFALLLENGKDLSGAVTIRKVKE